LGAASPHGYNDLTMNRVFLILCLQAAFVAVTSCGYHAVGSASHLPASMQTLAVPAFATRTESYHTETAITEAVIRELASRTRLRVTPDETPAADAELDGTILKEAITPLTYNASTQESSSFLLTIVLAVKLKDRNGRILYENKNYVFRQQYQSTTDLPTFLQETPAAVNRLSRDFAHTLVADLLDSF
jgi:outer membrane lipopolysaccharide assembly protein LptE/RlpB